MLATEMLRAQRPAGAAAVSRARHVERRNCPGRRGRGRGAVGAAAGAASSGNADDADTMMLALPSIDYDLLQLQIDNGAQVLSPQESEDELIEQGLDRVPVSFGNDEQALEAAINDVAVSDVSHWSRIRLVGNDRLSLLHNQSSNSLVDLQPGKGKETTFITAQARTVDLAVAIGLEKAVMLIMLPDRKDKIKEFLEKRIFPQDDVQIQDITSSTCMLTLLGPNSDKVLKGITKQSSVLDGLDEEYSHRIIGLQSSTEESPAPVVIIKGSGLGVQGWLIIAENDGCAQLLEHFYNEGVTPLGSQALERLRIVRGRPRAGLELTESCTVLEAKLWHTIDEDKDCAIGQETIKKVLSLGGKVRQQLWGVESENELKAGLELYYNEKKVGIVTSAAKNYDGKFVGLAFIRAVVGQSDMALTDSQGLQTIMTREIEYGQRGAVKTDPESNDAMEEDPEMSEKLRKRKENEARIAAFLASQKEQST